MKRVCTEKLLVQKSTFAISYHHKTVCLLAHQSELLRDFTKQKLYKISQTNYHMI